MALTVDELLSLPALAPAEPEILCGEGDRELRWVHTSEIFDIAPLLRGGEALLTSGLGLVGAAPARVRDYARSLVDTDIGALLFEVGRTFSAVPDELVDELRLSGIALVRLHGVVPFIDITEAAHRHILDAESRSVRASDAATTRLIDVLLTGGGAAAVLQVVDELTGAPAAYLGTDDRELAASGPVPPLARELDRPVMLYGELRGTLRSAAAVTAEHRVIVDRGAAALALELARSGPVMPTRRYAHEEFLALLDRSDVTADELATRANALGFTLAHGEALVALCASPAAGRSLDDVYVHLSDTAPRVLGPSIIGRSPGMIVVIARSHATGPEVLRALVERATAAPTALYRSITVSTPVSRWDRLAFALRDARDAVAVAPLVRAGSRPLLADDTALIRLLRATSENGVLDEFVDQQLAAVLDHDARRGSQLLRTLLEYFRHGHEKTATARALGIRRQTLYGRLDRIGELLGADALTDPSRAVTVHVATIGWSILTRTPRTGPDGQAVYSAVDPPASMSTYAR